MIRHLLGILLLCVTSGLQAQPERSAERVAMAFSGRVVAVYHDARASECQQAEKEPTAQQACMDALLKERDYLVRRCRTAEAHPSACAAYSEKR